MPATVLVAPLPVLASRRRWGRKIEAQILPPPVLRHRSVRHHVREAGFRNASLIVGERQGTAHCRQQGFGIIGVDCFLVGLSSQPTGVGR